MSCWVSAPWVRPTRFPLWPSLWPWLAPGSRPGKWGAGSVSDLPEEIAMNVQYGLICLVLFKNVFRNNKEKRSHALLALRNLCRVPCAALELRTIQGHPGKVFLRGIIGYVPNSYTEISSWGSYRLLLFWEQLSLSPADTQPELWQEGRATLKLTGWTRTTKLWLCSALWAPSINKGAFSGSPIESS